MAANGHSKRRAKRHLLRARRLLAKLRRDREDPSRSLHYTAVFEEAPEGGYVVRIPTLGCVTEGETFEQAKAMACDAIRCYVMSLIKHNEPIPEEGPTEIISALSVNIPILAR